MPITHDDQIDLDRVVSDPEYRRHVIIYLNAQAHRVEWPRGAVRSCAVVHSYPALSGQRMIFERAVNEPLRKHG
jgi:hypothetical protein